MVPSNCFGKIVLLRFDENFDLCGTFEARGQFVQYLETRNRLRGHFPFGRALASGRFIALPTQVLFYVVIFLI